MPFGWVDFSSKDRGLVLSVLESLTERGAVDELGVAAIRDGFANLFFPGTSTLQTRAKYFLIIPYALIELENYAKESTKNATKEKLKRKLYEIEKQCCEKFLHNNQEEKGVLGKNALGKANQWLKRTPSEIYMGGLNQYEIIKDLSIREYINEILDRSKSSDIRDVGNYQNEDSSDDEDTTFQRQSKGLDIKTYKKDWFTNLRMELNKDEANFLKGKIISSKKDTLLGITLSENKSLEGIDDFGDLRKIIHLYPTQIQDDYNLALSFSDFWYFIQILYNDVVFQGKNDNVKELLNEKMEEIEKYKEVDIEKIFNRLQIYRNNGLHRFLHSIKEDLRDEKIDSIKKKIIKRENEIKGDIRAKVNHSEEIKEGKWLCGGKLNYRFGNAKNIIEDIYSGLRG